MVWFKAGGATVALQWLFPASLKTCLVWGPLLVGFSLRTSIFLVFLPRLLLGLGGFSLIDLLFLGRSILGPVILLMSYGLGQLNAATVVLLWPSFLWPFTSQEADQFVPQRSSRQTDSNLYPRQYGSTNGQTNSQAYHVNSAQTKARPFN